MDSRLVAALDPFIGEYLHQVTDSKEAELSKILDLFTNKKVPDVGWTEREIEGILHQLSAMDSNNFAANCGMGEREARFASEIVARCHYRMGHGIGRSGDITAIQPKAAGSSLLNMITNGLLLDILKTVGAPSTKKCFLVPMATGMSIMLCLRTLHSLRPMAKFVIWSRIDQKSCFKCILTAGLTPVIINCSVSKGQLVTDIASIEASVERLGSANIVCVLTTTSCFAPRAPDNIEEVGRICEANDIPHLVNNAYGIQCESYMQMIERAAKKRVDMFVSSTDKNFMVPVGASVIAGFDENLIDKVGKMYPGRASGMPSMDVFVTLLNIGKQGYLKYLRDRNSSFDVLLSELKNVAGAFNEEVIDVSQNRISVGLTLKMAENLAANLITEIGSMLFTKFVSGTRVVALSEHKDIGGYHFKNWGSHTDDYECCYLTAAATIGIEPRDITLFIIRLKQVLSKLQKNALQIAHVPRGDNAS